MAHFPDEDVYAGLCGLQLETDAIDLGEGVVLRRTYAHLMAPFLVAFDRAQPGKPHPPPWKAAQGGFGFDLEAELLVPKHVEATLGKRIEIARLIVALMRFWASPSITIPVISNISLSAAAKAPNNEAIFLPLEVEPRYFPLVAPEDENINEARLSWVRANWRETAGLIESHAELRLAVDALDKGQFIWSSALALLSLWGALEAVFSPAQVELRFRVSALIASYLEDPGPPRHKLYGKVLKLYDQRSAAAHGRPKQEPEGLLQTFELLRQVVLKMISERHVPSKDQLEALLFGADQALSESSKNRLEPSPQSGAAQPERSAERG